MQLIYVYFPDKRFIIQIINDDINCQGGGIIMFKKWALLSTCAIATIVVIMALSELKDDEEEKEEL